MSITSIDRLQTLKTIINDAPTGGIEETQLVVRSDIPLLDKIIAVIIFVDRFEVIFHVSLIVEEGDFTE